MNKLIFDLGCAYLESTHKYLERGYNIVAVDAAEFILKYTNSIYKEFISQGQLVVLNKAIYHTNNQCVKFYLQPKEPVWNSLYQNIAERENDSTVVEVNTITLGTLIDKYGIPEYCKIDIEGADILALNSLKDKLPRFISCESECLGKGDTPEPLAVLNKLHELGYTKFHLEKQPSELSYDDIEHWLSYEEVKAELIRVRSKHFFYKFYDFWYDIFAKL